ncbi:MAG TPA: ATP-dependent helicase, partial [Thermodesulfobacteriota bacterium]|nr:ATP-dependent helicase [Thermodesulfobacteriota bacterium]
PSPFARSDWWRQVNQYMYMGDEPRADKTSRLRKDLLRELVFQPGLRPTVSRETAHRFEMKRQRLSPGYSPQTSRELLDWAVERLMIPQGEWEELLKAMRRDHGVDLDGLANELKDKLVRIRPPEAEAPLITAREIFPRVIEQFYSREKNIQVESITGIPAGREGCGVPPLEGEREDLPLLLGQWLQFFGPMTLHFLGKTLGMEDESLQMALDDLVDAQKVIRGQLVTDGEPDEICDSENFEILLRLARSEFRPAFEPLGIEWLPLFLAVYQGITNPRSNLEGLQERIEQLLCYPAEVGIWESEIFPARLQPYDPSWLDTLMQEGDIKWIGAEGHRVTFCFESDLDLLQEEVPEQPDDWKPGEDQQSSLEGSQQGGHFLGLFPDPNGRYDFSALLRHAQLDPVTLAEKLWNGVWEGRVTNDAYIPLRRAVTNKFKMSELVPKQGKSLGRWGRRRGHLAEGRERRFFAGNWHLIPGPELPGDILEVEERRKDRARLLLDRYGILFRELLQRELPVLSWPGVFRSLRIMELSGEVITGYFFEGIPGPQFISARALRILQRKLPEDAVYWVNAADPASLCGLQLEALKGMLHPRVPSTHLVYRGAKLVIVSKRNGKELTFHVPPDDPHLLEYLGALRHLLYRQLQPVRRIAIETINGESAPQSPYVSSLRGCFEVMVDHKYVNLSRKMA